MPDKLAAASNSSDSFENDIVVMWYLALGMRDHSATRW